MDQLRPPRPRHVPLPPSLPPQPATPTPQPAQAPGLLAPWDRRAASAVIDLAIVGGLLSLYAAAVGMLSPVLQLLTWAGASVGADIGSAVQAGYWFIICGWWLWQWTQRGRTGQTLGQELVGVWIVDEASGMPIGPGRSILRGLTHVLDLAPAGLGLLRPAWDRQRQTWADRVHHTVAITADQAA
jgi:RDD family